MNPGDIIIAGDDSQWGRTGIGLVDYSTTACTGWSSTTAKSIFYTKQGPLVTVFFDITGTSDVATVIITAPYFSRSTGPTLGFYNFCRIQDNGTFADGFVKISLNTNLLLIYPNQAAGNWITSGTKRVVGQLTYYASY